MNVAIITVDNRDEFRRYEDPLPYFGSAPTALLEGFARLNECKIHVISCVQQAVPAPEKIAGNIFYHSLVVSKIGWLRGGYLGCIAAVRRKLREIQPAVVHGQGTERYCALAAVFSGYPNVVTIHGNMRAVAKINHSPPWSFQGLAAQLEGYTLSRTNGVFCNSAYTQEQVRSRAKKIWRVPNALRLPFFSPAPSFAPAIVPRLLNVGSIEPRKNQVEILEMAGRLFRRGVRFRLEFVGSLNRSDAYAKRFIELMQSAEAAGYASYLGTKSEGPLMELMDHSTGFIHAPKEEAFGLVVAEALARNLKFFGFREGGVADICEGVKDASLVSTGDFEQLEQAISDWIHLGASRISDGWNLMNRRYHPKIIAARHLEIYREVLHVSI